MVDWKSWIHYLKECYPKEIDKALVDTLEYLSNKINANKKTLSKQNYVIDAYNRYFNDLDNNQLEQLKKSIIYNNKNNESISGI